MLWGDEDEWEPLRDEDKEEAPLFGCACENPLSVDDCCPVCIEIMRDMDGKPE